MYSVGSSRLSTFQQYCIFRHVVVTGTLSWLVLVFTNFGAFIQYLAECKVTSQIPVTTTGWKIQISQPIAENWSGMGAHLGCASSACALWLILSLETLNILKYLASSYTLQNMILIIPNILSGFLKSIR